MKILTPGQSDSTMAQLQETRASIEEPLVLPLFSEEAIQQAARSILSHALKAFATENLHEAFALFNKSLKLNRNDLLAAWNLARLTVLLHGREKGIQLYEKLLKSPVAWAQHSGSVGSLLRNELKSIMEGKMHLAQDPLSSIPQV